MAIDFTNTNLIWSSVIVETLHRLGLTTAVVCPGSRSAPLAIALAQSTQIDAIPVLDERSAAFFALGLARRSGKPVLLVCSSGTAAANFYPAIIEARESRVPLLVITADRPPEMRHCNSGQAIDQQKLYGDYPNWYVELALPQPTIRLLAYLRQMMVYVWGRTLGPVPGVVHVNLPLCDPLAPLPEAPHVDAQIKTLVSQLHPEEFFAAIHRPTGRGDGGLAQAGMPTLPLGINEALSAPSALLSSFVTTWRQCDRGVIIVGPHQSLSPQDYCATIARIAHCLNYPVLAEGLSPLRNHADVNPYLISTYDLILRQPDLATRLKPEVVIRFGDMPTSKELRHWLLTTQPHQWVIDQSDRNLDPLHGKTVHLPLTAAQLAQCLVQATPTPQRVGMAEAAIASLPPPTYATLEGAAALRPRPARTPYLDQWCRLERSVRQRLDRTFADIPGLLEAKVAWVLSQSLPPETPLVIANSTPVRDVEWFWKPNNLGIQPFFNRGANGIDGTLSTATGVAHRHRGTVLLTGDLALLHDTNGFLLQQHLVGHLTIILINNNGGGIFELLPISQFNPPFEQFFATPQAVNFAGFSSTYGIDHEVITTWPQLQHRLQTLPPSGIRLLEIPTDRHADAQWRQKHLPQFAEGLTP